MLSFDCYLLVIPRYACETDTLDTDVVFLMMSKEEEFYVQEVGFLYQWY